MATVGDAVLESRENIPLQKANNKARNCNCEEYLSGAKFIHVSFGTFTVIITVALLLQIYYGDYQVVPHGSVATDSLECSKIGTEILKIGGNSVDATIASALCLAVVTPHLASLDGYAQLLIYNHRFRLTPEVITFNNGNISAEHLLPRLVLGLAFVHQKYGSISWKQLVEPAAELSKTGFLITKMLVQATKLVKFYDLGHLEPGRLLPLEHLGETLEQIGNIPEKELYAFINEGNKPLSTSALKYNFNGYDIHVPGTPSMGPLFLMNLQQIETFNFNETDLSKPEYTYRLAEITQTIYLEPNATLNFHKGVTTNIAVMDLNDNYVSFVTGLNNFFGSGEVSATTGYILDEHTEVTPSYFPLLITDSNAICGRRIALAADTMATATQLVMQLLVGHQEVAVAVEAPRFLIGNESGVGVERYHAPFFSDDVLKYFETLGPVKEGVEPYVAVNVVEKIKDILNSHSDSRGGGIASRF